VKSLKTIRGTQPKVRSDLHYLTTMILARPLCNASLGASSLFKPGTGDSAVLSLSLHDPCGLLPKTVAGLSNDSLFPHTKPADLCHGIPNVTLLFAFDNARGGQGSQRPLAPTTPVYSGGTQNWPHDTFRSHMFL